MNGCNRVHLNSYIDEFMWRVNNTTSRIDAFEKILRVIGYFFFISLNFICSFLKVVLYILLIFTILGKYYTNDLNDNQYDSLETNPNYYNASRHNRHYL